MVGTTMVQVVWMVLLEMRVRVIHRGHGLHPSTPSTLHRRGCHLRVLRIASAPHS